MSSNSDNTSRTKFAIGHFLTERPGSFYHVGAGCPLPLHSAAFLPDGEAAVTAAAIHAAPVTTPVGRPDEVTAARKPIVKYEKETV